MVLKADIRHAHHENNTLGLVFIQRLRQEVMEHSFSLTETNSPPSQLTFKFLLNLDGSELTNYSRDNSGSVSHKFHSRRRPAISLIFVIFLSENGCGVVTEVNVSRFINFTSIYTPVPCHATFLLATKTTRGTRIL